MNLSKKIKYHFGFLFLLLMAYSCQISDIGGTGDAGGGASDDKEATRVLCRYWWQSEYTETDNTHVSHIFTFKPDSTGTEAIHRMNIYRPSDDKYYNFTWTWAADDHRSLCLKYGENNVIYMDDIIIAGPSLKCFLEGENISFEGVLY